MDDWDEFQLQNAAMDMDIPENIDLSDICKLIHVKYDQYYLDNIGFPNRSPE